MEIVSGFCNTLRKAVECGFQKLGLCAQCLFIYAIALTPLLVCGKAVEAAYYANEEGLILRNAVLDFGLMSGDDFNSQVNLSKMLGPKNSSMGKPPNG
jgi:fumarate hydratase class II